MTLLLMTGICAQGSVPFEKEEETTAYFKQFGANSDGYYSEYSQYRYVYENFFQGKSNGVFVDVGAHNGIAFNNSKFFEDLGWTGICVEPIPKEFEELQKNRKALCIQGCISDTSGTSEFWRITGPCETLSGLVDKYDSRHVDRILSEISTKGGAVEVINVNCHLLTDILAENGLFHIDYLSLDTEGGS